MNVEFLLNPMSSSPISRTSARAVRAQSGDSLPSSPRTSSVSSTARSPEGGDRFVTPPQSPGARARLIMQDRGHGAVPRPLQRRVVPASATSFSAHERFALRMDFGHNDHNLRNLERTQQSNPNSGHMHTFRRVHDSLRVLDFTPQQIAELSQVTARSARSNLSVRASRLLEMGFTHPEVVTLLGLPGAGQFVPALLRNAYALACWRIPPQHLMQLAHASRSADRLVHLVNGLGPVDFALTLDQSQILVDHYSIINL